MRDKKGAENFVADHLSRLPYDVKEEFPINEELSIEAFMTMASMSSPWYADVANYLTCEITSPDLSS